MLAKAAGVSLRSVQRILEAHQLAPHRIRTFKLSNDPKFAEKLKDIVGLYVDPPAHAVVPEVIDLRRVLVAGLSESSHCRLFDTRTKGQISLLVATGQS